MSKKKTSTTKTIEPHKVPTRIGPYRLRRWRSEDLAGLEACQHAAYADYPLEEQYPQRTYELQLQAFPEGQFLVECEGEVVAYATSLIVQLEGRPHLYEYNELTGSGTFSTHSPGGDTLYGADIAVHPDHRGRGLSKLLYGARKRILARYNLRRMVAYGRLTGFPAHAGSMSASEYVDRVRTGELRDPALSAHFAAGYVVRRVSLEIMRDSPSRNWATLLELPNPSFDPKKRRIAANAIERPNRKVRVCAAQYLMRPHGSWESFAQSVRFFVEVADEYHGHFLLLPELVTAALLPTSPPGLDGAAAMRHIAGFSVEYRQLLSELAREYGQYIVGGSCPVEREGKVYNVAFMANPSGEVVEQAKLHLTPSERDDWKFTAGTDLNVFETPYGRVAVLICYDVEFPELARLLALKGVDLLFVPFSTDERKAYQRVRFTAAARAIENAMYVVLAGSAGCLPSRNYLLNYARSAVLTPSDFGFPDDAVISEADPNVETVVVADLDLGALSQHRQDGSVRPLADLRSDLYEVTSKSKLRIVNAL